MVSPIHTAKGESSSVPSYSATNSTTSFKSSKRKAFSTNTLPITD
jgi:hypothetical protein